MDRIRALVGGRNGTLVIDTSVVALTTMLLVVVAARSVAGNELTAFALGQLVTVTAVNIVRSGLHGPAMAAQRTTGPARIPVTWLGVALPVAVLIGVGVSPLMDRSLAPVTQWALVMVVCVLSALAQDTARQVLISRKRERHALASDSILLVCTAGGWALGLLPGTATGILLYWAACGGIALGAALVSIVRTTPDPELKPQKLSAAWRLGRWSTIDITLASVATLLPMFVVSLAIDAEATGVYRTLQSALGPLNIIHTTVVTAFGLDAWKTGTAEGLAQLRRKVNRLARILFLGGAVYAVVALSAMIWITGVDHPELIRIAVVLMVWATLGATNSAFNAASLALGRQRSGAVLRALIVAATIIISLPWSASTWVPWNDPIGVSLLVAILITLGGWMLTWRRGIAAEERALAAAPEPEHLQQTPSGV